MPTPRKGESKNDFMSRCIKEVKKEGKSQDAAVGKCQGIWDNNR